MADNKKQNTVLHKRSTKKDVLPKGETLQYGEIAVNYNAEAPFLSIRKEGENKEYAKFSADEVIAKMFDEKYVTIEELEDNEEVIASALNELNDRIESIHGINIGNSKGESSLLQKVEVETFVDENPDSPTNGQEIPTEASGNHSVVLNGKSNASAKRALAHGNRTIAQGENSHTEGHCTQTVCIDEVTNGYAAHAEGYGSMASGTYSHAEGNKTKTAAPNSHAEGYLSITTPEAESAHAEGYETSAEAPASHTEGNNTKTHKAYSHAEGRQTETFGEASHTEGNETITEGDYAHAEGWMTRAKGAYSHAEGQYTFTYADAAHSEGNNTHAHAPFSHAEGLGTKTNPDIIGQHVEGYYNAESDGVKVIGCGTADDARMNAVEVKQDGRLFVKGLGNFDGTNSNVAADLTHVIDTKADKNDVYGRGHLNNLFNTKANKDNVYGKSEVNNLLNSKENISKKVQIISSASETSEYPSAKAVYDYAAPTSHNHDDRYYTESEIDKKFDDVASRYGFGNILVGDKTVTADINVDTLTLKGENGITLTPELDTDTITVAIESDKFAPKSHTHTKSEITDFAHNHDDRYYTESEVDAKISEKADKSEIAIPLVNVTYNELKDLRDNSQLIPGQQYRITDYVTTTTQSYTQSAGHQFDIIVIADDVNVLNENARAIQHTTEENDYFHNSNLAAWEIKYCLDNDTERFVWADATNGRGVIYYMKDEFNNECPYDFKNIQFARWELTNSVGYTKNANNEWVEDSNVTETYGPLKEGFCGLSNTNNNFTFGNSKFKIEYTISEEPTYCYTFGKDSDYSIDGRDYGNVIKKCKININKIQLNNIVFLGMDCINNTFGYKCLFNTFVYGCQFNTFGIGCSFNTFVHACQFNTFENNCSNNTFGNVCQSNTFGDNCQSNTFGNECQSNTFGDVCQSNTFGDVCQSNTFGNYCYGNTFGNYCYGNTFGNYCYGNTFGDECENNTFGNECENNTFGNVCQSNTFGNECENNTFGNVCQSNTFGNECENNTFGDYCTNNTFGNYCYGNTFGDNCQSNTFGNYCYYNTFGNYCYYNTFGNYCYYNSFRTKISTQKNDGIKDYCCYNCFEDGVQYVNIWNAATTGGTNNIRNVRVKRGICGTDDNYKHINIANLGMSWEWIVASNTKGEIKQYCEADLIA